MKKTTLIPLTATLLISALFLQGCGSTTTTRVDVNKEIALTDKWNDQDSLLVSKAMITDMFTFPWYEKHRQQEGNNPTIIIQQVRNKSHEHIPVETFLNDLKRAILRSGHADFVANADVRTEIREERKDQEFNSSIDTQNAMGEEQGADYALSGSINSTVDQLDGKRVTFYQVDLRLIDMTTNKEVWNGQEKIKKYLEKSRFGF
jgi:uncharacterized protein (TIGR02722 family)